jgi:nucleotide-binding universal stress UspA family protein
MKTILFPTDFSPESLHAAQYAVMVAKGLDAKIVILHSFSVPTYTSFSENQLPYDSEALIVENKKIAEDNIEDFTLKLLLKVHFKPEQLSTKIEYGFIAESILDTAKSIKPDLIMMSTMGASNFFDKWLGTNTEKVVDDAHCPVWVIPENVSLSLPKTIIYAADFKDNEFKETKKLLSFAKPLHAISKVIHIHDNFEMDINGIIKDKIKNLESRFKDENISFKDLKREDIVDGIETYIKTHHPDVLAISIAEKSFFNRIFDTGVSKHFVLEAKWPLLIFRK